MSHQHTTILNVGSWILGMLLMAIGLVNSFYGNDTLFGISIVLGSLLYFPPVVQMLRNKFGLAIPLFLKVLGGIFAIWAAVGVGDLFIKINTMLGNN